MSLYNKTKTSIENIKSSVSSQGYAIYKNKINETELQIIQDDLTIKPFVCPGYGSIEETIPYKLFKENTDKIYVPYYYGISKYGKPEKNKLTEPLPINLIFATNRAMRPYQDDIINTYIKHAMENSGGIISVGCGRGKTVMALKIVALLSVKTIILVHKEFLMNQWVERINEYLPGAKIGFIQGKKIDIEGKDIILAMIQSLSDPRKDKDYPPNLLETVGLVIADECHHLAARQFVRSLAKYTFKYTLGLSATPTRADNLQHVFKHYLGDIIYKDSDIQQSTEDISLEHIPNSTVDLYVYHNNDYKYCKEELNFKKKPNVVIMKSNIAECEKRTKFILSFIPKLIADGRTILLLSCRREHIFQMEKMLLDMAIPECTVGLYLGGMKQVNLDISASKRVIIATFNMAEEAFDCKTLNTLIYATPHNNIEQAVGRILREEKKKRQYIPLIIDVQDIFSSFNKWNKTREKYYKSKSYPMQIYDVEDNSKDIIPVIKFIKTITPSINSKTTNLTSNKIKTSKLNQKHNNNNSNSNCGGGGVDTGNDGDIDTCNDDNGIDNDNIESTSEDDEDSDEIELCF